MLNQVGHVPIDKFKNVFPVFEFSFKTSLTLGLGIENVIMGLLQVGDIESDRHKPLISRECLTIFFCVYYIIDHSYFTFIKVELE